MDFLLGVASGLAAAAILGVAGYLWRLRRAAWMPSAHVEYVRSTVWTAALGARLPLHDDPSLLAMTLPEVREWLGDRGAVDYGTTTFRLFIQGAKSAQVILRDVRFRITVRRPPFTGAWVSSPNAGASSAIVLLFDLDDPRESAWEGHLDGAMTRVGSQPYFETHHVALAPEELVQFRVEASIADSCAEWHLEVHYEARGRRRVLPVLAPDGQPFKTTHCGLERFESTWLTGVGAMPGERFSAMDPVTHLPVRE